MGSLADGDDPATDTDRPAPPRDIDRRTYSFALRVLKLVRSLPRNDGTGVVGRQLARSGTSIGANVEEAQGALTRRSFAHRMNIARSEARETLYWLRLVRDLNTLPEQRLTEIITEADELVRILTAIVKTTRARQD